MLPRSAAGAARRRPLGGAAACRLHVTAAPPPPAPPTGLCSVPWLRQPADFMIAAKAAVAVCNALVGLVEQSAAAAAAAQSQAHPQRPGLPTLRQLDAISDTLCKVLDVGEFVRTNHAGDGWRDAAEETYRALGSYMHTLNTHTPLHAALVAITSDAGAMGRLSHEQQRMAVLLQREFEREGIHLDDAQRAELVRLNDAVHEASAAFQGGARDCAGAYVQQPGGGGGALARAVQAYLSSCDSAAEAGSAEAALNTTASRAGFVPAVLQHVADPAVRRQALVGREGECAPNLPALAALGSTRQELASRIGFPSYAHMVLADRMAGSPANVGAFLSNLRQCVAPTLARDLATLSDAKRALFGAAAAGADPGAAVGPEAVARARRALAAGDLRGGGGSLPTRSDDDVAGSLRALAEVPVYPWDVPLLQGALAAASPAAGTDGGGGSADDDGSPLASAYKRYATVGAVLRGLQGVVRAAFGVEMVREPVRAGEAWDLASSAVTSGAGGGAAGWARHGAPGVDAPSSLFKYRLVHESEGDLGVIYFDLFARPGKYAGAAHYVIRCGKALHEFDGAFEASLLGKEAAAASSAASGTAGGGSVQLPIVALVTNFAPPSLAAALGSSGGLLASLMGGRAARSSPSSSAPAAAALTTSDEERVGLLPREVETLYHEFGHALHSMLSRTQFQHLHGAYWRAATLAAQAAAGAGAAGHAAAHLFPRRYCTPPPPTLLQARARRWTLWSCRRTRSSTSAATTASWRRGRWTRLPATPCRGRSLTPCRPRARRTARWTCRPT
jgi:mitochondrial intermediate peptidase